jgi:hypothetical protein
MSSPTSEEISEKSSVGKSAGDSEVENTKPAQTAHSKVGIDAE